MPNPAAAYCEQNGSIYEIRTADDGSQSGVCVFPDSSTCDEWAYFKGECGTTFVGETADAFAGDAVEKGPGSYMPSGATEEVVDWWGVIRSTPPGAQFDDYYERQDLGQIICFGIDSIDSAIKSRIEDLRDSDRIVHLYGTLVSNVPDYNGSQILVDRIEVEEYRSEVYQIPI
jgi:hypothetical protein